MATLLSRRTRPQSSSYCKPKSCDTSKVSTGKQRSARPQSSRASAVIISDLRRLQQRLTAEWDSHQVPARHRTLFCRRTRSASVTEAKQLMLTELEELLRGSSLIVRIGSLISRREAILQELRSQSSPALLEEYRTVTLDTLESIAAWLQSFELTELTFEWNGVDYIQKCRNDTAHFKHLGPRVTTSQSCGPFLLEPTSSIMLSRHALATRRRMHSAVRRFHLMATPRTRRTRQVSRAVPDINSTVELSRIQSEEIPKPAKLSPEEVQHLSQVFAEELLVLCAEESLGEIALTSCSEMVAAALSLHSSAILDQCLTETLDVVIPEVAREAREEERSREYISIRDMVFAEVFASELRSVVFGVFNTIVAEQVTSWIMNSISLQSIVEEALEEEAIQKAQLGAILFEGLVHDFVDCEWTEQLAEAEVNQARLEASRRDLPVPLQKEIFSKTKESVFSRVAEEIYFDVLNTFVGGYWLSGLFESCMLEADGEASMSFEEIFILQDPTIDIEALKEETARMRQMSAFFR